MNGVQMQELVERFWPYSTSREYICLTRKQWFKNGEPHLYWEGEIVDLSDEPADIVPPCSDRPGVLFFVPMDVYEREDHLKVPADAGRDREEEEKTASQPTPEGAAVAKKPPKQKPAEKKPTGRTRKGPKVWTDEEDPPVQFAGKPVELEDGEKFQMWREKYKELFGTLPSPKWGPRKVKFEVLKAREKAA